MTQNTKIQVKQVQELGLTLWIDMHSQSVSVGLEESWYVRSVVSLPIDLSKREIFTQLSEELQIQFPSEAHDWLLDYAALNEAPPVDGLRTWVVFALANKHMSAIHKMCSENQWRLVCVAPLATLALALAQLGSGPCFYPTRQQRQRQLWRKRYIKGGLGLCAGLLLSFGLGSGYSLASAYWGEPLHPSQEAMPAPFIEKHPTPEPWMVREFERDKSPLEFYHLGDLRLVGFIQQGNHTQALIRVHGQQSLGIQSVRIGDYLGKNFGRVLQITDQSVVLQELQQDASGLWSIKKANLQLADDNI